MRNLKLLKEYIRMVLEKKDVIGEPDLTNKKERDKELKRKKEKNKEPDEASIAGMPGVSTPLGTPPTYPSKIIKKNKKRIKTK